VAIITRGQLRAFGTLAEITRQLSQLRPIEILLTRPEQMDSVVNLVRQQAEKGAEISPAPAEGVVRLRTSQSEEELARLLAALVAAGLGIAQFREVQTDLEEAYMTVAHSEDQPKEGSS
jgi:ABC-2 type transport system ATP-binding protein